MSNEMYIARFRNMRGRYLVRRTANGYEGQRISDARQAKYGNSPDPESGLYLKETWCSFGACDVESLKRHVKEG